LRDRTMIKVKGLCRNFGQSRPRGNVAAAP